MNEEAHQKRFPWLYIPCVVCGTLLRKDAKGHPKTCSRKCAERHEARHKSAYHAKWYRDHKDELHQKYEQRKRQHNE